MRARNADKEWIDSYRLVNCPSDSNQDSGRFGNREAIARQRGVDQISGGIAPLTVVESHAFSREIDRVGVAGS